MTAPERADQPGPDESLQPGEAALLHERNARILGVLVLVYLGLLTLLGVSFGIRLTIYALLISLGLVASMALLRFRPTSRWAALRAWVPYLVLAMAYELIRGFAPAVLSRVDVDDIPGLERLLFGGRIATELLQTALRPLSGFDPLAAGASIVYMLHTPLPLVVGAYLWWRRRRLFYDYLAALTILSMAAFTTYLIYPAAPPWWAAASGHLTGPSGLPLISYLKPDAFSGLTTGTGIDGKALFTLTFGDISPDPVAAFPSLHAAYPLLAYLFLRKLGGPAAWGMLAFTLAAWFSIVYLGDHYVIDILGGVAYVAIVYRLLPTIDRLLGVHGPTASGAGRRSSG
jgi:hypothetical protein